MATISQMGLMVLLLMVLVLGQRQTAAATSAGDGPQRPASSPLVSSTGSQRHGCSNSSVELPLNIAVLMPASCGHFRLAVTSPSNTAAQTTTVALDCYQNYNSASKTLLPTLDDELNIIRLTSSSASTAPSSQLMVVPRNNSFSVSVYMADDNRLFFVVRTDTTAVQDVDGSRADQDDETGVQGDKTAVHEEKIPIQGDRTAVQNDRGDDGWSSGSQISIQATVIVANWSSSQEVLFDCNQEDVQLNLTCLNDDTKEDSKPSSGPRTSFPSPAPNVPSGRHAEGSGAKSISSSTTTGPEVSSTVILTVTVCGVLILVLALLFGLWHWQRRKLHQRRNSYQHQVLKRQTEGASFRRNQQSQTLDLRLSDIEDQEQFQQLRPQLPKKPRTFVKMIRTNSRTSATAAGGDVSSAPAGGIEYANVPPSGVVAPPSDCHARRGHSTKPPFQDSCSSGARGTMSNTVGGSGEGCCCGGDTCCGGGVGGCGCAGVNNTSKATIPKDNILRNLSDEGGVTGPYWFHSTRKPDARTALKIYRV